MASLHLTESDWLSCCGSSKFAKEMAKIGPFQNPSEAVEMSRQIWWSKVDIPGWLEAFAAHPRIGDIKALSSKATANPDWCEGEQSAALSSANDRTLKELAIWNRQYESKFGFVFIVCATGKSSSEILQVLKARITNRPLMELQVAANEQQKIIELRLRKHLCGDEHPADFPANGQQQSGIAGDPVTDGRLNRIEAHILGQDSSTKHSNQPPPIPTHDIDASLERLAAGNGSSTEQPTLPPPITTSLDESLERPVAGVGSSTEQPTIPPPISTQSLDASLEKQPTLPPSITLRPPITTHVLDVSLGKPAAGVEVSLEYLRAPNEADGGWIPIGTSVTNEDGRSGPLMQVSDSVEAGRYRITFNTGKYLSPMQNIASFYPYVSVVFDIHPSQTFQHFHVPLLLSPFSFTTYRGS